MKTNKIATMGTSVLMFGLLLAPPALSTVQTVFAAETNTALIDNVSPRSITISKYSNLVLAEKNGTRDDGKNTTVGDKHIPVEGAEFKIERYKLKDGVDPNNAKSPKILDMKAPKDAGDGIVMSDENGVITNDYELDPNYSATVKTDADGKVTLDVANDNHLDGYFLVTEITTAASNVKIHSKNATVTRKVQPYLVALPMTDRDSNSGFIYDVKTNPKNDVTVLESKKTIADLQTMNHSVLAGSTFSWFLKSSIPQGLESKTSNQHNHAEYFGLISKEDPNLLFAGKSLSDSDLDSLKSIITVGYLKDDKSSVVPIDPQDFKVEVVGKDHNVLRILLTDSGIDKVKDAESLVAEVKVSVDKNFNGIIPNNFDMIYKTVNEPPINVPNIPGIPPYTPDTPGIPDVPTTPKTPDSPDNPDTPQTPTPDYWTGGFHGIKLDEQQKPLANAVFKIADSEEHAKQGIFMQRDGKDIESTTNDQGEFQFNGLPIDNKESLSATAMNDVKKDYFLVETTSPKGKELIGTIKKVTVTPTTHLLKASDLTLTDKDTPTLPFTGSQGLIAIIIASMAAMFAGFKFFKKSNKTNE